MNQVIALEAIRPRPRDIEAPSDPVDVRFSPSFVDLGVLQLRACALSAPWRLRGYRAYPDEFKSSVQLMLRRHVRHIQSIEFDDEHGWLRFTTEDTYGRYQYAIELKADWFAKE